MIKNGLKDFQIIPRALILDERLDMITRFVYCYIATKNANGKFAISYLANDLHCKEDIIKTSIESLISCGWLSGTFDMVDDANNGELYCYPIVEVKQEEAKEVPTTHDDKLKLFEECWVAYRRKGNKKVAKEYWLKLSDKEKGEVLQHTKAYVSCRDLVYQADFQRYLRDKTFETIVFKGKEVIFDPTKGVDASYRPNTQGEIFYNESNNQYLYVGFYYSGMQVFDGYKDEERPNGATLVLNNARGTITWDANTRMWNHKS